MPASPNRLRVTWICVLLLLLPAGWLLGAGPCNCLQPHLPRWGQGLVTLVYYPLPWLVYESGLADTTVGNWYAHYLAWWAERMEG